jgi:hypothetical protein
MPSADCRVPIAKVLFGRHPFAKLTAGPFEIGNRQSAFGNQV